jgi:uncharacterized protein YjiS (DUF1127 family)
MTNVTQTFNTSNTMTPAAKPRVRVGGSFRGPVRMFDYLVFLLRVRRERLQLTRLDAATLKDLGLNQSDVYREASRTLIDLPDQHPVDRRHRVA